ncbi:NADP-dependent oxidoreductase [Rhodococcus koreensis]|uniref:NADP-dependent oxidoreductase n=1 Tax=Rhodococcus koreensis TaxID=99653 RepID=UPI00366EB64D
MKNRQWTLASHAQGEVTESQWTLVESEVPAPGPAQILVRNLWLSVDPYMRGKLNAGSGMEPGDVMMGGGVGEVVASDHPDWQPGDLAEGLSLGWQDYAVLTPDLPGPAKVNRVDTGVDPQAALSWSGMPGLTAYFAMLEVGRPRPGDTVVVSAAAGAVGQLAGQIAKLAGARVVGIAGSGPKLQWCERIGFDAMIDYKTSSDLSGDIARVCPEGVNVFFDGTGGVVHDAVMQNLALAARVAIVGRVATAGAPGSADIGMRASSKLIETRATVQGFVVYDWWHRRDEGLRNLKKWHAEGKLAFREDVVQGIENVPHAFLRMMRGENFGKQLVAL